MELKLGLSLLSNPLGEPTPKELQSTIIIHGEIPEKEQFLSMELQFTNPKTERVAHIYNVSQILFHLVFFQFRVLGPREEGLPDRTRQVQGAARPPLPPQAIPRLQDARLQDQGEI